MEFKSNHDSYRIQCGEHCIAFKNGKYKTDDKKEIALLKTIADVKAVAEVVEAPKKEEKKA